MPIGDTVVRGRIDAVFVDPDGGATVVDWKTAPPHRAGSHAVQPAVHRLACRIAGMSDILGAYRLYYVRSGITVVPDEAPAILCY